MASRLESVPAELGLRIVEYIPRPSDLKALCLTSQTLRIPATTALYRRVTLRADVGGWRHQVNQVESGFLSPTNSGLHQIRELLLESEFNWPDEDENEAVEKVLMALPPNILRDFDCCQFLIDEDAAMALLTRQQNLKSLSLGPLTFNLAPFIRFGTLAQHLCKNLSYLRISETIGSLKDLDFYKWIIDQGYLRKLSFMARCMHYEHEGGDDNTESSISDQISSILFHHIKERYSKKKLQLDRLCLGYFDVGLSKFALPKYIDFCSLPSLVLCNCPGGGKLISLLAGQFKKTGSKLRYLEFRLCEGDSLSTKVVERLLMSFTTLRELALLGYDGVDNTYHGLNSAAFKNHSDSLEKLTLHPKGSGNWSSKELGIEADFYMGMSKTCRKLRQVAVPVPNITLPPRAKEELVEYVTPLIRLLGLPDLKVLRILNWPAFAVPSLPNPSNSSVIGKLNTATLMQTLDHFMVKFISGMVNDHHPGGTTPILCFDSVGRSTASDGASAELSKAACYVPQRLRDVYGKEEIALQKVDRADVKYFEPECALLFWP